MFETVGKARKQSLGQQLTSLGLTVALSGGTLLGSLWAGKQVVEEVLDEEIVEVTFFADAAPPPPPPPPPPAGGNKTSTKKKKPDEPKPDPVEVEPEPVELEPEPEEETAPEEEEPAEEDGVAGGVEGGEEGGVEGGVVGGEKGGVIGGQLGGTGTSVSTHYSKVKPKRKVEPRYPQAATDLGMGVERCIANVVIDVKGKPKSVDVLNCPSVFHAEVKRAMMAWRFYPYKSGGTAMEANFKMPITFKP